MSVITSASIKSQLDYHQTIKLMNMMLSKTEYFGSVLIGQQYAEFYLEQIKKMLESEYINIQILSELQNKVENDLRIIKDDCDRRLYISNINKDHIDDNRHMMSMILDFILSIKI